MVCGYFFVDTLALRIHASVATRGVLLAWIPRAKYLLKEAIIIVFTTRMMLGEDKSIAARSVLKLLIRKSLVHLVRVVEATLLIDENIGEGAFTFSGNPPKMINMHPVIDKVKVKRYRWIARLDLWLPSEHHIRHHARSRLYKWKWGIFYSLCRLDYYLLIRIYIKIILFIDFQLSILLVFYKVKGKK